MALFFKLTRNDISPALSKMAAAARKPEPVYRAMGTTFMSITMGNFKSGEYRAAQWAAKKDGTPATLQKSGTLSRAFHLQVTNTFAKVSNPMAYATIHQFGATGHVAGVVVGKVKTKYATAKYAGSWNMVMSGSKGVPPRPYFPVLSGKLTREAEDKIRAAGERAMVRQFNT